LTDRPQNAARAETPPARSWFWGRWSRLGLIVAFAALAADQIHKWWMLDVYGIAEKGRVAVAPFLDLVFVKNTGISYSMFDRAGAWGQGALAGFAVLAVAGFWAWLARGAHTWLSAASLALVMGGALGNALDRVRLGGVADFFSLHAFGFYWYVFNVADVAIVAGVIGLLYDSAFANLKPAAKQG